MEPKLHFGTTLRQMGLDPANAAIPEVQGNPIGTGKVFHANVLLRSTSMRL